MIILHNRRAPPSPQPMKQFFKFMFASMLGMILAGILLFFLFAGFVMLMVSSVESGKKEKLEQNSVLHIRLDLPITERSSKNPFDQMDFPSLRSKNQPGLYAIIESIDKAAGDERITGIFINTPDIQSGLATVEEIRTAILRFKESGKYVIAYAPYYSQSSYYLATAADQVFLQPEGMLEFKGYHAELLFFKGTFEKLEIEPQVIRHGKYKSAVEPFVNDRMSDENREQIAGLVDDFWQHTVRGIADSRKLAHDELLSIADSFRVQLAADAERLGLVDDLVYEDEVLSMLSDLNSQDSTDKPRLVSLSKYSRVHAPKGEYVRERIAVVFGAGEISGGEGDGETIGSRTMVEAIRKARMSDRVKAIVLRVNSPGGQALASDEIWREVRLTEKEKPVVVSMGDLAASGGYYISCAASRIVAQPNTITGSIGVLGVLLNFEKFLKNKLGITTDHYKTSEFADLGMPTHKLSEAERQIIRNIIEDIYNDFTSRVAEGRSLEQSFVDSIGQGRIWSGEDARQLGLVDSLGGLHDAIRLAAELAGIDSYRVRELPDQEEPLQQLLKGFSTRLSERMIRTELGDAAKYYLPVRGFRKMEPVQARLPYHLTIQ